MMELFQLKFPTWMMTTYLREAYDLLRRDVRKRLQDCDFFKIQQGVWPLGFMDNLETPLDSAIRAIIRRHK